MPSLGISSQRLLLTSNPQPSLHHERRPSSSTPQTSIEAIKAYEELSHTGCIFRDQAYGLS